MIQVYAKLTFTNFKNDGAHLKSVRSLKAEGVDTGIYERGTVLYDGETLMHLQTGMVLFKEEVTGYTDEGGYETKRVYHLVGDVNDCGGRCECCGYNNQDVVLAYAFLEELE